jgi:hypothetical protein
MAITSTAQVFYGKKKGAFLNGNIRAREERTAYFEPTLTEPLNFDYGIPIIETTAISKFNATKPVVIKATATSTKAEILGFTKIIDRDPSLFFKKSDPITIFKPAENDTFFVEIEIGETIVAGDKLEFVPANNTYKKTAGGGIVKAVENGAGGDLVAVQVIK